MMNFGIIAMLLVGVSWIVWGYVAGVAPKRKLDMGFVVAACAAVSVAISLVPAMRNIPDFHSTNVLLIMLLVFGGGVFNYMQLQLMGRAMKYGPNGIIWSIIQSGFICPFAVGIIFFGVPLTVNFIVAVSLVILALILFAVSAENKTRGKWLLLTILSFAATCSCQSLQNIPSYLDEVAGVSSIWRTLGYFSGMLAGFLISLICDPEMRKNCVFAFSNKFTWLYALLIDAVEIFTCYCLLFPGMDALAKAGQGAIATQLMTASSIITFELYALCILKEKRKPIQIFALLCCLAAIIAVF